MSKCIVKLCDIPEFKLRIQAKRLVWYRFPVCDRSEIRIKIFNSEVCLGFSNDQWRKYKQVEYWIPSKKQLSEFYQPPLILQICNGEDRIGFCQFQPRTIIEKPIIAPIISKEKYQGKQVKLGDIQIQFLLKQSATEVQHLLKLKSYLDTLDSQPYQLEKLHQTLRKENFLP